MAIKNTDSRPNSIKLGVHVRRGDYKTWQGGKYYYSDEQYADVILRFASLHKDKDLTVFVCGNAPDFSGIKKRLKTSTSEYIVHTAIQPKTYICCRYATT